MSRQPGQFATLGFFLVFGAERTTGRRLCDGMSGWMSGLLIDLVHLGANWMKKD